MNRRVRPLDDVRVSAVIPYFNHGRMVEDALDSLRRQTRPVEEIIVVDDGSTDPFSLSVLARLKDDGVTVVRQQNQGPGSARNLGLSRADGDALLFLDSDDIVTEQHVDIALGTLRQAPDEVGFVYPDMQFMGNEHHQVIMPPYNLYLLLYRNFCCMGGLIDRSVFDAGFQFRTDLAVSHEDWEFFVTLGLNGIFGQPFHEAPLGYRRWGYSRSDGVNERLSPWTDTGAIHELVTDGDRLMEIKCEWAPALSVVVRPSNDRAVADQTCADFEIVLHDGSPPPPTRGRWVLMLSEDGADALSDDTFIERVLRLVSGRGPSSPVALYAPVVPGGEWRKRASSDGSQFGVVSEERYYLDWSRSTNDRTDLAAFSAYLDATTVLVERWEYARSRTGDPATPLALFRTSRPPPGDPESPAETYGVEVERSFRRHEAPPLFMPARGTLRLPRTPGSLHGDLGAVVTRAWLDWMPSRSRQLDLVVDVFGQVVLEVGDGPAAAFEEATSQNPARIPIGLLWTQPFPGTACLASHVDPSTQSVTYRVVQEGQLGPGDSVLGYVSADVLPGRIDLRRSMQRAARAVRGPQRVTLPVIEGLPDALVEDIATNDQWSAEPYRWPLYEASTRGGPYRYSLDPDSCIGRTEQVRPFASVVAEVAPPEPGKVSSNLYEVSISGSGVAYVLGSEVAASSGQLVPVRSLGSVRQSDGTQLPVVRLLPDPPATAPPGSPGHRLALTWSPLVEAGHRVEGVLGFVWKPEPDRAPLYRWRDDATSRWALSLGDDIGRTVRTLKFEGALGLAWWSGTGSGDHVDLWEMVGEGRVAFATDRRALTGRGFVERRVIARVLRSERRGSLPLFSMVSPDENRWLLTTSPGEGESLELGQPSLLGFVDPPKPGRGPDDAPLTDGPEVVVVDEVDGYGNPLRGLLFRQDAGGRIAVWRRHDATGRIRIGVGPPAADAALVGFAGRGMMPHGHPVYGIDDGSELWATSEIPGDGVRVHGVLCFMPGVTAPEAAGARPQVSAAQPRARRRRWGR